MPLKLNIAEKSGKTWKIELEEENIVGKSVGEKVEGKDFSPDLEGYELEITGATDIAGFVHMNKFEGTGLNRVILTKGWGMKAKKKGLRKRKTVRGKQLSEKTKQVNVTILKPGKKALKEIFPDQNKAPEKEKPSDATADTPKEEPKTEAPKEQSTETPKVEEKKEEPKVEEKKEEAKVEEKPQESKPEIPKEEPKVEEKSEEAPKESSKKKESDSQ